MPRPDRTVNAAQQQMMPGGGLREDIRALNSSILLITQKIKYLVRNEKILGRNLIVLNKKIKSLEEKVVNPVASEQAGSMSSAEIEAMKQKVSMLEGQVEDVRSRTATKEELKELKFIIDSINPLEFATLSQVRDLVDKRMQQLQQQAPQAAPAQKMRK